LDEFLHDISWVLPLRSETATHVANAFTYLGYAPFFIIALPLAYWLWDKKVGVHLALIVILTAVTNGLLKDIFDDPRPDIVFAVDPRVGGSYGLPSGHAQVATAMWFWIARELRLPWFWPVAALIVFGVIFSRLYLGVHDVEDVLTGFGLGLATILVFSWFLSDSDQFRWWRALNPALQMAVILLVQVPIYLLWPEDGGPGGTFAVGGMLAGWWAGTLIERRHIHYRRHPNWLVAIGAAAAGLAFCFFVLTRIGLLLANAGVPEVAAGWVQYFVIALFVAAIAPWLFVRLGVARTEAAPAVAAR
jgi:membrane-associated phospholipid phosphatase